ncbi:MAG: 7,8-dihydro-6-hydroxymethylpterin dimethyltransferase [Chloroflexota bacterium]|nr:7,8-dihydro-6-hydroxymethylpterin dimethyltransferase [Chloroflexota bacterium]
MAAIAVAERPYLLRRMVLALCGECLRADPTLELEYERDVLQGVLAEQDGAIWLRRRCRRGHGEVVSLYEEDAALWAEMQTWRAPARWLEPDSDDAVPIPLGYTEGLSLLQEQHTCILLVDLTEDCNLSCPPCFASSRPGRDRYAPAAAVLASVDAAIAREGGQLDLVMLSGGEPTLHPQLEAVLDGLLERDVRRIVVNTNGLRLARDDVLVARIAAARPRIELYLQWDGPSAEASHRLRGADLAEVHRRALERVTGERVFVTLACMVAAGVNGGDVGEVLRTALDTPYVGGVVFQPLFGAIATDPVARVTTTGIIRRLGAQAPALIKPEDFVALPCSHPDCTALTYLVRDDHGAWRSLPDLLGRERMRDHLGLASNRLMPDDAMWEGLSGLLSGSMSASRSEMIEHLVGLASACSLDVGGFARTLARSVLGRTDGIEEAARRVKRISVKGFMDPWTLNVERLRQCCVHVATVEPEEAAGTGPGVRIPFCARNTIPGLYARANRGHVAAADLTEV